MTCTSIHANEKGINGYMVNAHLITDFITTQNSFINSCLCDRNRWVRLEVTFYSLELAIIKTLLANTSS